MAQKVRLAVIGLGMGMHHAQQFCQDDRVELVALCDQDSLRLQQRGNELEITALFANAQEMFKKVKLDAVSIATPNKYHAPLSIAALKAGLHVLCEKPMAMNTREAQKMCDSAKTAKRNLMINFSYRFSDLSFALKQQVANGSIGDIYFGRTVWHRRRGIPGLGGWFTQKELAGGGPLIDLGVHRLDLALWLMGYPEPRVVSGSTYNVIAKELAQQQRQTYNVEDLACGIVKFANGATLIIEASWALNIGNSSQVETLLCGTKGGLIQRRNDDGSTFTAEMYTEEDGNLFTKKLDQALIPAPSSYNEFISSIVERRPPLATAEQGLKVMKILDGIYRSAQTGREVRPN